MAERQERWNCYPETPSLIPALTSSQLLGHPCRQPKICLSRSVGILKLVGHKENYLSTSNFVTSVKSGFLSKKYLFWQTMGQERWNCYPETPSLIPALTPSWIYSVNSLVTLVDSQRFASVDQLAFLNLWATKKTTCLPVILLPL